MQRDQPHYTGKIVKIKPKRSKNINKTVEYVIIEKDELENLE